MNTSATVKVELKVKTMPDLKREHADRIRFIAGLAVQVDRLMTSAFHSAAVDVGEVQAQAMLDDARKRAQESWT